MIGRVLLTMAWVSANALGQGVLHYGLGARDAGSAGVFASTGSDALAALQSNPAALDVIPGNQWSLSLRGGVAGGSFISGGRQFDFEAPGTFPEFGFSWRPEGQALTLGVSMAPIALGTSDWNYPDAPGGIGGVSYGQTIDHGSGFAAIRANAGLSWRINECLSVGASFGVVYSQLDFDAPFIFQTNPALAGAKVNLDLETDGWEAMSEFGVLWRPTPELRVAVRYRPQVDLDLKGSAAADFSAQLPVLGLGGTPAFARYQARTGNALPAVLGTALAWQPNPDWRFGVQLDWIGWGAAFDTLEVDLSGGSNGAINAAIGANPSDRVPVQWKDRWLVGVGAEHRLTESWTVRAGWRWSESPVSAVWITPLNSALLEHTLAVGVGWQYGRWRADLSYEYRFGSGATVGSSGYRAGEYRRTKLDMDAHVFGLGLGMEY